MKIACTGSSGRVGQLLTKRHGFVPLISDITNKHAFSHELDSVAPDIVFHLAGISNVDFCEVLENQEQVIRVNFKGALNVIEACNDRMISVVYLSSGHVFSGRPKFLRPNRPYKETDTPDRNVPNYYGLIRLAVEGFRFPFQFMNVIRTSYLFNYMRLMTEEIPRFHETLQFPTFMYRSYMYLPHFGESLKYYADHLSEMPRLLHVAGNKSVSQYQFIRDVVDEFQFPVNIEKRNHPYKIGPNDAAMAERPHNGGLDVSLSAELGLPQYSYLDGIQKMKKDNLRG